MRRRRAVAKQRLAKAGVDGQVEFKVGDMLSLPFEDNSFNVVLSTFSMCPVTDPAEGARELFRVTKPSGLIGVAHSTDPGNPVVKWLRDKVESLVWRMPSISLGCRAVSALPVLEQAGCEVTFKKQFGVPLWPFVIFVAKKTRNQNEERPLSVQKIARSHQTCLPNKYRGPGA